MVLISKYLLKVLGFLKNFSILNQNLNLVNQSTKRILLWKL